MIDHQPALARMLDEASIQRTIAHFADAATRADYDAFRAVWADDAQWTIGDPPRVYATGIDDIEATLKRLRAEKEFFVQFATRGVIAVDGDTATSRSVGHEAARGPGESFYRNHYMVHDRLVRAGDCWIFTARTFHYIWLDTAPFGGLSFSVTAEG